MQRWGTLWTKMSALFIQYMIIIIFKWSLSPCKPNMPILNPYFCASKSWCHPPPVTAAAPCRLPRPRTPFWPELGPVGVTWPRCGPGSSWSTHSTPEPTPSGARGEKKWPNSRSPLLFEPPNWELCLLSSVIFFVLPVTSNSYFVAVICTSFWQTLSSCFYNCYGKKRITATVGTWSRLDTKQTTKGSKGESSGCT